MAVENDGLHTVTYRRGADLPDFPIAWRSWDRVLIPFSSTAYTFTLRLAAVGDPDTIVLSKTTGFLVADVSPNLIVTWNTSGDLNSLAAGTYLGEIEARRTGDGKQRIFPFRLILRRRIGP